MQNGLFNVTEEQQSLVELIRDFMTKEIKPHVLEWEKEGHYPQEIIEQGIEMGLHMLQVPEEYGGMGLDTTTTAMMIEEGAKVESTFMGMFNVTSMGGKIVMAAGNEEQKQYYSGLLQNQRDPESGYCQVFTALIKPVIWLTGWFDQKITKIKFRFLCVVT